MYCLDVQNVFLFICLGIWFNNQSDRICGRLVVEYCFLFVFQWGGNKSLLAVNSGETVIILNEQVMNAHYNHEVNITPNNNYSWYKKLFFKQNLCFQAMCFHSNIHLLGIFVINLTSVTVSGCALEAPRFHRQLSFSFGCLKKPAFFIYT